tara:strand:- start:316 stop:672 length:357 start_codon:yes stop_codon:yes gene_type:complete
MDVDDSQLIIATSLTSALAEARIIGVHDIPNGGFYFDSLESVLETIEDELEEFFPSYDGEVGFYEVTIKGGQPTLTNMAVADMKEILQTEYADRHPSGKISMCPDPEESRENWMAASV